MKTNWIEASQLPESEKVYLKKDFMGWRVVAPWKNEDGTINWFNLLLGGKKNLIILIILTLLCCVVYLGILEYTTVYRTIAEHPCEYCKSLSVVRDTNAYGLNYPINVSIKVGDNHEAG